MHHDNYNQKHDMSVCLDGKGALASSSASAGTASTTTLLDGEEDEDSACLLDAPLFRAVAIPSLFNAAIAASKGVSAGKQPLGSFGVTLKTGFGATKGPTVKNPRLSPKPHLGSRPGSPVRPGSPIPDDLVLREWKAHAAEGTYVLPCYYPVCEKRSATSDQPIDALLERLFVCFKKLNIQASIDTSVSTFGLILRTAEQVELSLLIWWTNKSRTSLYVELDKRQGGSGMFPHQYICRILKVIRCRCTSELDDDSICIAKHQEMKRGNCGMAERCRKMDRVVVSFVAPQKTSPDSGMTASPFDAASDCVADQALSSLEMVLGLLKNPVTWFHGLELLQTLSDPNKSGVETSKAVSKVILLGVSPTSYGEDCCCGIHEKLIHFMQALVGDESIEMNMEHLSAYQRDCLLHLVLTCLVNAMEVHIKFVADGSITMADGAEPASVLNQFLESTKDVVAVDILQLLMAVVRRAQTKPHHAYLAVKALFLLSSENSTLREFVSLALAAEDKSQRCAPLKRAHEVGMQSNELLEAECERLRLVLQSGH